MGHRKNHSSRGNDYRMAMLGRLSAGNWGMNGCRLQLSTLGGDMCRQTVQRIVRMLFLSPTQARAISRLYESALIVRYRLKHWSFKGFFMKCIESKSEVYESFLIYTPSCVDALKPISPVCLNPSFEIQIDFL